MVFGVEEVFEVVGEGFHHGLAITLGGFGDYFAVREYYTVVVAPAEFFDLFSYY